MTIEHTASIISFEIIKQITVIEAENRIRGGFISDILDGKVKSPEEVLDKSYLLGYDLKKPYQVMYINIEDGLAKNKDWSTKRKKVFDWIQHFVISRAPNSIVVKKDNNIAVLLSVSDEKIKEYNAISKKIAYSILENIKSTFKDIGVSVGLGRVCHELTDFKKSMDEAVESLSIIHKLGQKDVVIAYDEMGIYALLASIDKVQIIKYIKRYLGPLVDYDIQNDAGFMKTLVSFLESTCNRQKTAEKEYVHINTINYRIRRIEEIAKIDLKDPETRLNLHVAIKAYKALRNEEKESIVTIV